MKHLLTLFFLVVAVPLCGQTLDTAAIRHAVERQLNDYPESTLQDIYKSFYQNRFGTGHMISDLAATERYLHQELEVAATDSASVNPRYWEPVGADTQHVRIYLQAVIDGKVTPHQLNDAFVRSAEVRTTPPFDWATEWQTIVGVIDDNHLPVNDGEADRSRLDEMSRTNTAVHHSSRYNTAYHPHYRVVRKEIFAELVKGEW